MLGTMRCFGMPLVLATLLCLARLATAARVEQATVLKQPQVDKDAGQKQLNTYYFDVSQPHITFSAGGSSSRPQRTALTVTLAERSVSKYMPVVTPKVSGMTHAVSKTWQALMNLATMFTHVHTINKQGLPSSSRLFPKAALAVSTASDNSPVKLEVASIIAAAEAHGQRSTWAEVTPSSVLLLPTGQSTGAVADLLGVTFDERDGSISLELEVVHNPRTISEFSAHGQQTLQVDDAHYHFATAPGVKVDAQAFLDSLKSSGFSVEGMHVFMKGSDITQCLTASMTADRVQAGIGSDVKVTVHLDDSNCRKAARVQQAGQVVVTTLASGYYYWTVDVGADVNTTQPAGTPQGKATPQQAIGSNRGAIYFLNANVNGDTEFTVRINSLGCGSVMLYGASGVPFAEPPSLLINCRDSQGAVSSVELVPHKAYRHVHDPVELTALVLDANKAPAPGVKVAFSVFGDCDPATDSAVATTGADGTATIRLRAHKPGAVSVVAAATNAAGAPVLSGPSHVFFFTERHDADEREEAYFGHGREHEPYEDSNCPSYLGL